MDGNKNTTNTSNNDVKTNNNGSSPIKPSSITSGHQSQISKPHANVTKTTITSSSPQASKINTHNQTDDDDDHDGGVTAKQIAKKQQEVEDKKKKKDELKKKKQAINTQDPTDEDEDGGISHQKYKNKEPKPKKKSVFPVCFHHDDEDEDEDGGTSKRKLLAAEKKKQAVEEKKQKAQEKIVKTNDNNDDDDEDEDGGTSKQKILAAEKKKQALEEKKKKTQQKKVKNTDTDDDDDDGVLIKQETKKETKSKKNIPKVEDDDYDDEDEDGGRILKTYNTVKMMIPSKQPILDHQSTKKKSSADNVDHDDDKEDDGRTVKTYNTIKMIIPSKQPILNNQSVNQHSSADNVDHDNMKSTKHKKASTTTSYDTISKLISKTVDANGHKKSKKSIENNYTDAISTDEGSTTREITAADSSVSDSSPLSGNNVCLLRRPSYRKAQHRSPPTVSKRSKVFSSFTSQTDTKDDHNHSSKVTNDATLPVFTKRLYSIIEIFKSLSNHSSNQPSKTAGSGENHSNNITTVSEEEKAKIKRKKVARNRWFLAYTIIRNPHLFDLRKQAESRLIFLRSQKTIQVDEQLFSAISTDQESATATIDLSPQTLRIRRLTNKTETSLSLQPPTDLHLTSTSNTDKQLQSPAEQYIAIRSQMLYTANEEQSSTSRSLSMPHIPSTIDKFTDDYPCTTISSMANSSGVRTQMTHDQHMQAWHENELRKLKKKRSHRYMYGTPPKTSAANKNTNAAILTPQILQTPIKKDKNQ